LVAASKAASSKLTLYTSEDKNEEESKEPEHDEDKNSVRRKASRGKKRA
jgi:hypothetical protein